MFVTSISYLVNQYEHRQDQYEYLLKELLTFE